MTTCLLCKLSELVALDDDLDGEISRVKIKWEKIQNLSPGEMASDTETRKTWMLSQRVFGAPLSLNCFISGRVHRWDVCSNGTETCTCHFSLYLPLCVLCLVTWLCCGRFDQAPDPGHRLSIHLAKWQGLSRKIHLNARKMENIYWWVTSVCLLTLQSVLMTAHIKDV